MVPFFIFLDEATAAFYTKVASSAERPIETVLADTLFKLAGELSLNAIYKAGREDLRRARPDAP